MKDRLRLFLPLLGLFALTFPAFLSAHPVILLTYKVQFRFDAQGLVGFEETWWFDEVHSQMILQMFDANHDGQIDDGELPALKKGFFDDLSYYNYFSSIVLDGKAVPTKSVSGFSARFENRRMIYRFFVPLRVAATASPQELDVTLWDPTYYTDLSPHGADALSIEKPSSIDATISIANDHRHFYNLAPGIVLIKKPPFYLKMMVVRFHLAG